MPRRQWIAAKGGASGRTMLLGRSGGPSLLKVQAADPGVGEAGVKALREDVALVLAGLHIVDPALHRCDGGARDGSGCGEWIGLYATQHGPRCYRHLPPHVSALVAIVVPPSLTGAYGPVRIARVFQADAEARRRVLAAQADAGRLNHREADREALKAARTRLRSWWRRNYEGRGAYRLVPWAI